MSTDGHELVSSSAGMPALSSDDVEPSSAGSVQSVSAGGAQAPSLVPPSAFRAPHPPLMDVPASDPRLSGVTVRRALEVVTPPELAPRTGLTPDPLEREKAHWMVERMSELETYAGSVLASAK